ncbi:MAG: exopolysaccharide biosynthesis protein [Cyanobacteriota bacterium]|nr:exopolysaccharide biosynthesis protein [Cyanobacteriota bacterium]
MAKLSTELHRYFFEEELPLANLEEDRSSDIKLGDILALAGERTFGFIFVIVALPSAVPLPAVGYSIPFGLVLFTLAIQLIIGRKQPWLPQRVVNHPIKRKMAQKFVKAALPGLGKLEALTQPRMTFVCTSIPGRIVLGCAIALMATFMMIPIPGTNTFPALAIFIMGFGLVEDDGAISLGGLFVGAFVTVVMVSVVLAAIWGGSSLLDALKAWIKNLI